MNRRRFTTVSTLLALAAGLAMRLAMMKVLPQVSGDTLLYGGMARNLLLHGQFAITDGNGVVHETLIRLPGYPLMLAACFRIFGIANYNAVSLVQIGLELWGCLLLASFVRQICSETPWPEASAQCTLWLAALCPFTAAYAVAPLTETPTLFAIALALWALAKFHARPGWGPALAFTFAITFAALLRPDGALVGVALAPPLVWGALRSRAKTAVGNEAEQDRQEVSGHDFSRAESAPKSTGAFEQFRNTHRLFQGRERWLFLDKKPLERVLSVYTNSETAIAPARLSSRSLLRMGVVCFLLAMLPFGIWTARNWRVFHVFQPLAPRYATDPGEAINPGWQRWMKTWCLDFVSTYQVYWNVPGSPLDVSQLPARAFDSPAQSAQTAALAAAYHDNGDDLSPQLDDQFGALAAERIHAHPLRYYLGLPLGRMADMWLRPRVENLNIDLDWWVYSHHYAETRFSWAYAGLNALYLLLALAGLCLRPRYWPWLLAYFVLRSLLLMTIEAPEARYTLECFPMLFALGGISVAAGCARIAQRRTGA